MTTSLHNSVSPSSVLWFSIFYILYSGSKILSDHTTSVFFVPQFLSISTILYIFPLLYSMFCSLSSIHVIYLSSIQSSISSHFYMLLSSVSSLFFQHSQVFYSICSSILLSNSLQLLSQVHCGEYSKISSAEIFNTYQCQLSTLHFMNILVYNSLTFHIQLIVTTLSSNMI